MIADVCNPTAGEVYKASWGSTYRVLHQQRDGRWSLQDLGRSGAYVTPTVAELTCDFELVAAAPAPCTPSPTAIPSRATSSWSPPPRPEPELTLGAVRPAPDRRMGVGAAPYWQPCARRFEGDSHAWFLSDGAQVLCPACRRDQAGPEPRPWSVIPPKLEPDAAMFLRQVGARVRAKLGPAWWAMVTGVDVVDQIRSRGAGPSPVASVVDGERGGLNPAPAAATRPPRCCDDCGRELGLAYFAQDDSPLIFCGRCIEVPAHLQVRASMGTGSWKPTAVEERSAAKADVGSFDRSPPPVRRPPLAEPATRQEAWSAITKEFPR